MREGFLKAGFPESVFSGAPGPQRKYLLDLGAANLGLLRGLGFTKAEHLNPGPACTHCEPRLLSYRRNTADPRRMYNFMGSKLEQIGR